MDTFIDDKDKVKYLLQNDFQDFEKTYDSDKD